DTADVMVALAADALTDTVATAYADLGLIGPDGFALAEGAVALVCERAGHAAQRGARVYGRLLGHGIASDGLGAARWDGDGEGVARAVSTALEAAGVAAGDLAGVYTSAAGLAAADAAEAAALDRVVGTAVP